MPKIKLDDRMVNSLMVDCPTDFTDIKTPGEFGVRIFPPTKRQPKGRKMWFLRYTVKHRTNTKRRRKKLGEFPAIKYKEAKEAASLVMRQLTDGVDPELLREERQGAMTFGELAQEYLEFHSKPNKKSWREDERIMKVDLLPAWGDRLVEDITRAQVRRLLVGIAHGRGAKVMANRTHALVSHMFTYALDCQIVDSNPIFKMRRLTRESERERVLSHDEIRTLWSVWTEEDSVISAALRVLLLTGQRSSEVLGMAWDQLEETSWWDLPSEMTKAARGHRVYLIDRVKRIIEPTKDYYWVFPGPRHNGRNHISCLKSAVRRHREITGIKDWCPHDLRRTFSTWMYSASVAEHVIHAILNHAPVGVTRRHYNKYKYANERRVVMTRWADHLRRIITGEKARVLPFGQPAAFSY